MIKFEKWDILKVLLIRFKVFVKIIKSEHYTLSDLLIPGDLIWTVMLIYWLNLL